MAGIAPILAALARVVWRDLRTFSTLSGNNFFLVVALIMFQQWQSGLFFIALFGILLLVPLAGDPMRKIPPDRLTLWPLTRSQRIVLRLTSPALTPLVWIAIPFLFRAASVPVALGLIAAALVIQVLLATWRHIMARRPPLNPFHFIPTPPGKLGGLMQKNARQQLSVLDPYVALLLCLACIVYRLTARNLDPEASVILSLLVAIALSTQAQCLFGLDLPWGIVRYRLLPLRGREILLAKDAAFLAILVILVLPLAPLPGLAAGLVALGIGHHDSVLRPMPQHRWRFTGGAVFPSGFFQVILMTATGVAVARQSLWYLAAAIVFYLGSLWYYGRQWDAG
ncbi:MAG TPA: hypothetical protein VMH80_00810 [Bryobacteraceae bacterium]|nr:hypothetical protein [Bryobacteraceae bacterium]